MLQCSSCAAFGVCADCLRLPGEVAESVAVLLRDAFDSSGCAVAAALEAGDHRALRLFAATGSARAVTHVLALYPAGAPALLQAALAARGHEALRAAARAACEPAARALAAAYAGGAPPPEALAALEAGRVL